jgi:hypothetical protein
MLLDVTAQVFVDGCRQCRIFIGPCSSTVFLRDCEDCQVLVLCKQLRLRDCAGMEIALFCESQPVVESSRDIRLGCAQVGHGALGSQLENAGLNPWNSTWWDVHDFTPRKDPNYSFFVAQESQAFRRLLAGLEEVLICSGLSPRASLIPLTQGPPAHRNVEIAMAGAKGLLERVQKQGLLVHKARECELSEMILESILSRPLKPEELGRQVFLMVDRGRGRAVSAVVIEQVEFVEEIIWVPFKDERE